MYNVHELKTPHASKFITPWDPTHVRQESETLTKGHPSFRKKTKNKTKKTISNVQCLMNYVEMGSISKKSLTQLRVQLWEGPCTLKSTLEKSTWIGEQAPVRLYEPGLKCMSFECHSVTRHSMNASGDTLLQARVNKALDRRLPNKAARDTIGDVFKVKSSCRSLGRFGGLIEQFLLLFTA